MGSARSAFLVSALLCVSNPAFSAELESPTEDSRPSGLLGHSIIHAYGAVIPEAWGSDFGGHPGWGTGFSLSYGIARAVQISIGFAYHRMNIISAENWDALRQVTTSIELVSPARDFVRPWLGVGLGYYEEELYSRAFATFMDTERGGRSSFVTNQGSLGINWGAGVALHISDIIGVEAGGRYHRSLDSPTYGDVELLSVEAGLSYVIH